MCDCLSVFLPVSLCLSLSLSVVSISHFLSHVHIHIQSVSISFFLCLCLFICAIARLPVSPCFFQYHFLLDPYTSRQTVVMIVENSDRTERCNLRFFTISSLCCEMSPTCTRTLPGRCCVAYDVCTSAEPINRGQTLDREPRALLNNNQLTPFCSRFFPHFRFSKTVEWLLTQI